MISVPDLQSAIRRRVNSYHQDDAPLTNRPIMTCTLLDSQQQILAEDIVSSLDVPRQNLSAMDGYAIADNSDLAVASCIEIIGESQAGTPFTGVLKPGQGIRVFTGAVVPDACTTVVMQEHTNFELIKNNLDNTEHYEIVLSKVVDIDTNIRKQGEEIQQHESVLQQGKRITPADIGLLASLGVNQVKVFQPLTVGLLTTGDELVALGDPLTTTAQIYNSNTPTLKSLLAALPIVIKDFGIIADDQQQITKAMTTAMQECDVVLSTAGVSVGDYDYLATVTEQLGQINHYSVAMKPGRPFVFGELTHNVDVPVLYFGLPGNPLSTVVSTLQFVIPALWHLSGAAAGEQPIPLTLKATLMNDSHKSVGRTEFQRGLLTKTTAGDYQVDCFERQQSHRIKQLSQANCLIVLAQDSTHVPAGCQVDVQPFSWLCG